MKLWVGLGSSLGLQGFVSGSRRLGLTTFYQTYSAVLGTPVINQKLCSVLQIQPTTIKGEFQEESSILDT